MSRFFVFGSKNTVGEGRNRATRRQSRPVLETLEGRKLLTLSPISPNAGYPYTTGVELQITYPDGRHFVGSGTLVGANDVLTAGHVVYDYAEGGWATSIVVTPEYNNGSGRFGSALMTHESTYPAWLAYSKAHPGLTAPGDMDIALISLNKNIGNSTGWLSYGYNNNNNQFASGSIMNTFGYPAAGGFNGQQEEFSSGQIAGLSSDGSAINFYQNQITIYGGSSGSPLYDYFPSNGSRVVYGVVVGGGGTANSLNFATRITQNIFNDFQNLIAQEKISGPVAPNAAAVTPVGALGVASQSAQDVPAVTTPATPSTILALVPLTTGVSDTSVTFGLTVPTMKPKANAFAFAS